MDLEIHMTKDTNLQSLYRRVEAPASGRIVAAALEVSLSRVRGRGGGCRVRLFGRAIGLLTFNLCDLSDPFIRSCTRPNVLVGTVLVAESAICHRCRPPAGREAVRLARNSASATFTNCRLDYSLGAWIWSQTATTLINGG